MLSICSQSYVATAMLVAAGARLELTNSHLVEIRAVGDGRDGGFHAISRNASEIDG